MTSRALALAVASTMLLSALDVRADSSTGEADTSSETPSASSPLGVVAAIVGGVAVGVGSAILIGGAISEGADDEESTAQPVLDLGPVTSARGRPRGASAAGEPVDESDRTGYDIAAATLIGGAAILTVGVVLLVTQPGSSSSSRETAKLTLDARRRTTNLAFTF